MNYLNKSYSLDIRLEIAPKRKKKIRPRVKTLLPEVQVNLCYENVFINNHHTRLMELCRGEF